MRLLATAPAAAVCLLFALCASVLTATGGLLEVSRPLDHITHGPVRVPSYALVHAAPLDASLKNGHMECIPTRQLTNLLAGSQ